MKLFQDLRQRLGRTRFRLIPIVVAAITLAAGMRVGEVYTDASFFFGIQTAGAQSAASSQQSSPPAGGPRPLTPQAKQSEPAPPAGKAPDSGKAPPTGTAAVASADAKAQQEAVPALPALPPPAASNRDPTSFSKSEVELLQSLSQRREALETRAKELDLKENLLAATARQVDEKIAELKAIEARINGLIQQRDEQEEQRLRSLVKVYENMKPGDAARIFEQLDMPILLDVVERMKEAKIAPVLAQMNPTKAKTLTSELAARRQLPSRMPADKPEKAGKTG